MASSRIQDYAIIGDSRSAALVSRSGSIDWLCWPRFESPSLFAAILDAESGGHWSIAPTRPVHTRRHYVADTNVLVTELNTGEGTLRLTDLMPVCPEEDKTRELVPEHEVLRLVDCVRGEVQLVMRFQPRPGYGRKRPRLRAAGELGIRVEDGSHLYTLRGDPVLHLCEDDSV